VIIEAFSQQTPVIARNLGGMPKIIEESKCGFVYDTEEELVTAMDYLLSEPSYRCALGLNGYKAYQREWTPEAYLKRYFALIREIAAIRG
jgi:glycosyltransferase involved in cell wall biosynthesis